MAVDLVVHARRCDEVCKMWRVLRIGLMSFATRPGQPWCRGLVGCTLDLSPLELQTKVKRLLVNNIITHRK